MGRMFVKCFFLLFFLLSIINVNSQNIESTISFGDSLFRLNRNHAAINEYQRAFFFSGTRGGKAEASKKIACCYLIDNNLELAFSYYDTALLYSDTDSSRIACELDKILCIILENDFVYSLKKLDEIETRSNVFLANRKRLYQGICYFGLARYDESYSCFNQIIQQNNTLLYTQLHDLYAKRKRLTKPNPALATTMSIVLPGSGQAYAGKTVNGINSLVLLSALAYIALYTPVLDFFVILPFFYRYYVGGILNANTIAKNSKTKKQSEVYSDLIGILGIEKPLNLLFSYKDVKGNYSEYLKNAESETNIIMAFSFLFYKKYFSSQDMDACVFEPSCSVYTIEAIQKKGSIKGILEGLDRLLRCHFLVSEQEYPYNIYTKKYYDCL